MTITARYNGRCTNCGGFIQAGDQVDYTRGVKGVRHIGMCPATPAQKPAPKPRINNGDSFDRAAAWLNSLASPTEFEQSLITQMNTRGGLSERQIEVCLNAIAKQEKKATAPAVNLPDANAVPTGRYAIRVGDSVRLFRVWRGTRNPSYVKLIEQFTDTGSVVERGVPFEDYGLHMAAIILQGLEACAVLYGKYVGRCGKCGLKLTDRVSVELGIGPVCGRRMFGEAFRVQINSARARLLAAGIDPDERVEEEVAA